ncbi:MAG: hypothetical protein AB7I19_04395 [Planctomycetota bacterium]
MRRCVSSGETAWSAAVFPWRPWRATWWTVRAAAILLILAIPAERNGLAAQQAPVAPQFRVHLADDGLTDVHRVRAEEHLRSALTKLAPRFPGTPSRPFDVFLHSGLGSLSTADATHLHPGTPGFAVLGQDRIHILYDQIEPRPPNDLRTVLHHELVHVLVDQFAGDKGRLVPRWLHEGLAQSLSGETYLRAREVDLLTPLVHGRLLPLRALTRDFPDDPTQRRLAYHQSYSFVDWLIRRRGLRDIRQGILWATELDNFIGGFAHVTQVPLIREYERWQQWITHESGAPWLFLFQNCFSYVMILGFVALAYSATRVHAREARTRRRMDRELWLRSLVEPRMQSSRNRSERSAAETEQRENSGE